MDRKYGNAKSEAMIIKSIGATPVKNSGRGQKPGDATWNDFMIDVKETARSFTLSSQVWSKTCTDAMAHGLDPMLLVVMGGRTRLAVVEYDVLEDLIRRQVDPARTN